MLLTHTHHDHVKDLDFVGAHADIYLPADAVPYVETYLRASAELNHGVGHIVWSSLKPVVEANPDTLVVLTHFSLRHSDQEVLDFFADGPANVLPWAHPKTHLPEQHQK